MRYLLAFFAAFVLALALAEDNPISYELETYIVSEVEGQERFTEADTARPGQVVEYRLIVVNEGDTTLPPGTVVITGPVPEGTRYVENSASPSSEELLTEFSGDGTNYGEPPIFVEENDNRQMVDPDDYLAVRWTLLIPFEPQQEVTFIYRVTVE